MGKFNKFINRFNISLYCMSVMSHHFDAVAAGVEDRNQEVHVQLVLHLFNGFVDFLVSVQSLDVVWLLCMLRIPSIHLKKIWYQYISGQFSHLLTERDFPVMNM